MSKYYETEDKLTKEDIEWANNLLDNVRKALQERCGHDQIRMHKLRRKIFTSLTYDERGGPAERKKLKLRKMAEQGGICTLCGEALPKNGYYAVLDRKIAHIGYTDENVNLVHSKCDYKAQEDKGFR